MTKHSYSEDQLRTAIANASSIRGALRNLGLNATGAGYNVISKAIKVHHIDTSHFTGRCWNKGRKLSPKRDISDYLSNKHPISSHNLRLRLLSEGIFDKECQICHNTSWNGKDIPLELDHINGNHDDNSLDNLRIICPNCHAQTDTHAGKNKGKVVW